MADTPATEVPPITRNNRPMSEALLNEKVSAILYVVELCGGRNHFRVSYTYTFGM